MRAPVRCCLLAGISGCWLLWALAGPVAAAPDQTEPVQGLRDGTPTDYALLHARIVVQPGEVLEDALLIVRDGVITQVRSGGQPPAGIRTLDMTGKTIYPGLLDAFSQVDLPAADASAGAPYWNPLVQPQRQVARHYQADKGRNASYRGQGVTARLVAPATGIIKGRSAVVTTADAPHSQAILADDVFQHMRLTVAPSGSRRRTFPASPMGAVALARQALYDAQWYRLAWAVHRADSRQPRPERNDALAVLKDYLDADRVVAIDAPNELYLLRADLFAREFGLPVVFRGSGNEYRRLDAVRQTGRAVIVPVNFPKAPNVGSAEAALDVSLERLMHWDLAPENPARLHEAGVPIAFTSEGLDDLKQFLPAIRKAVRRGLPADAALDALTRTPARLFGLDQRLGTLHAGKLANFLVTDGELFERDTKVLETWIQGTRYEIESTVPFDWRGSWELQLSDAGPLRKLALQLEGTADKLKGNVRPGQTADDAGDPIALARVSVRDSRLSGVFPAKALGREGFAQLTIVLSSTEDETAEALGQIVWPDGSPQSLTAVRTAPPDASTAPDSADSAETSPAGERTEGEASGEQPPAEETPQATPPGGDPAPSGDPDRERGSTSDPARKASFAVNYPLGGFGLATAPDAPRYVLFRNATIWTCGKAGVLNGASLLVGDGRILAVGQDVQAPAEALVVDCQGRHITPGIIDCHSHMATDGGVNEGTQSVTAEVRIGDFIDCDDIAIYQQLAGGVTTASILHGSANAIGGQNQVIKLRWGALPEQMKFAEAPPGIKFALGENVKQSNWGDDYTSRYPQTRMGVEQIIRDTFESARDYMQRWKQWEQARQGSPPRKDLEMEAIAEVLRGERWIHCHSYRQDEILALIRTLDEYRVTIGTFQHILEGYKVADAMARHGAMGSSFSDWWAYKFEVFDAIPYNGALMHQAGVVVSFNSDDRELARHLNHEAAKAVRYGGVAPEEALKFVTLNPARQLRIDQYVGSLEPGKQADLVVWTGEPLSTMSRCEQTWIDGRRYFDRQQDLERRQQTRSQRATLIQKILASGEAMLAPGEKDSSQEDLWPREDIYCHGHDHGDHGHH